MPAEAFAVLQPHFTLVEAPLRTVLAEANTPTAFVYFLLEGIASTTITTGRGRRLEIGLFGREGMSPTAMLLGADRTPYETFMQVGGAALRAPAAALTDALQSCTPLRAFLLRYAQTVLVQAGQTALANGAFKIEERTARWLLMCHDRIDGDMLPITHEFLGFMLAVRRSGVTEAIHVLEGEGMVRARRGVIEIVDRTGLERIAGESYGTAEAEYERLVGPWRPPSRP